jgi:hypothetical protein
MNFSEIGFGIDVLEEVGEVDIGHVLEGEFPEFGIFIGIEGGVVSGVFVTSIVSEPDVVAFVGEHEAWGFVFIIDEEGVAGVEEAVLQDDGLESGCDERIFFLNSEHSEDVAVFGFYKVFFNGIFVVLAVVDEGVLGLGVGGVDLGKGGKAQKDQQEGEES